MKDENSKVCHLIGLIRYINDIPDSKNNIKIKRELNMQEDNKNEQKQYFVDAECKINSGFAQLVFYGTEANFYNKYEHRGDIEKIDSLNDLFSKYYDTDPHIIVNALDLDTYEQSDIDKINAFIAKEMIPYMSDPDSHECRLNDLKRHFENNFYDTEFDTESELEKAMVKSFSEVNELETGVLKYCKSDVKEFYGKDFIELREELKKEYAPNLLQTKTKKLKM